MTKLQQCEGAQIYSLSIGFRMLTYFCCSAVIFSQVAQALIIGSVYFGTPLSTGSFFAKGAVLFFAVLLSALQSIVEINTLYAQRPIVAKHKSYAFYHPFTEAVAGILADLPIKFCVTTVFNVVLYFLAGLRAEPSQFFIFFLFNFMAMLTMSAIFRCTAAVTKTISAALAIAGIMVLWIVIYTGFTIQRTYMQYVYSSLEDCAIQACVLPTPVHSGTGS